MKHILSSTIFVLFFMMPCGIAQDKGAQLQLEVRIPERLVMYFDAEASADTSALSLGARERRSPDLETVFDLNCATLGALPRHCQQLYGGALLDTRGRPYPPVERTASGQVFGSGSFPQFFEAPTKTLRVYTPVHHWRVQVEMPYSEALSPDHFSVFSSTNGWHCLGYHPDWQAAPETCLTSTDASRANVTAVDVATSEGGWHDITLGLKLRLDGSEAAGRFESVLRYTLVTF